MKKLKFFIALCSLYQVQAPEESAIFTCRECIIPEFVTEKLGIEKNATGLKCFINDPQKKCEMYCTFYTEDNKLITEVLGSDKCSVSVSGGSASKSGLWLVRVSFGKKAEDPKGYVMTVPKQLSKDGLDNLLELYQQKGGPLTKDEVLSALS